MDIAGYREEIKLMLCGDLLDLELEDATIDKLINASFRELQRYIDTTVLLTIPYQNCIDLSNYKVNTVVAVYRTSGYISSNEGDSVVVDPMFAAQWQLLSGVGNLYNFNNYALNYATYNTLLQIRNTTSTDLFFKYDPSGKKLYINIATDRPNTITIEYIPRYDSVSDIVSDFWIDILIRLAVAQAKIVLGRIRSKYSQSNALWALDGNTLLSEGNAELSDLRDKLVASTQLCYPID